MDDEELQPRARLAQARPLETFSVEELRAYETALTRELEQVRAVMREKESHLSGADKLFKL